MAAADIFVLIAGSLTRGDMVAGMLIQRSFARTVLMILKLIPIPVSSTRYIRDIFSAREYNPRFLKIIHHNVKILSLAGARDKAKISSESFRFFITDGSRW